MKLSMSHADTFGIRPGSSYAFAVELHTANGATGAIRSLLRQKCRRHAIGQRGLRRISRTTCTNQYLPCPSPTPSVHERHKYGAQYGKETVLFLRAEP